MLFLVAYYHPLGRGGRREGWGKMLIGHSAKLQTSFFNVFSMLLELKHFTGENAKYKSKHESTFI
jgi:hypothetical protein